MNPDLLAQLRDIHAAPLVSWWPPAPGWWVLALLLLMLLIWAGRVLLEKLRILARRKQMLGWVEHLNASIDPGRDPQAYLSTINRIFKLVALRAFSDQHCAVMTGQAWVDFLTGHLHKFPSAQALSVLATGPYDPAPEFDPDTMSELARSWIRHYG